MWTQSCLKSGSWNAFWNAKKGVLDRDPPRKPDYRPCERKALSERDSCVCILKMRAEAIHKRMGHSGGSRGGGGGGLGGLNPPPWAAK